jgi:CheY-like chemotaxis protein
MGSDEPMRRASFASGTHDSLNETLVGARNLLGAYRFCLSIPSYADPIVECERRKAAVSKTPLISIVDDDEMSREATAGLVEAFGLAYRTFASAEAFLGSGCVPQTSCLIADIQMPGLNGLQLHYTLIRSGHRIPVIFITAYPDERWRDRALKAGAICYLNKPFDPIVLRDYIRSAIAHLEGGPDA